MHWHRLGVAKGELELSRTLPIGQSFAWRRCPAEKEGDVPTWRGVVDRRAVELKQTDSGDVLYRCGREAPLLGVSLSAAVASPESSKEDARAYRSLHEYFRLDVDFLSLDNDFRSRDERYARLAPHVLGCRMLQQPPVECLFSFICSSNNNIARITKVRQVICTTTTTTSVSTV